MLFRSLVDKHRAVFERHLREVLLALEARAMDAAPVVEMYANSWCPYCSAARALLGAKQARVIEINVEPGTQVASGEVLAVVEESS